MKEEKILWCETHDDSRWRSAFNTTAIDICSFAWEFQNPDPCRMVERVLGSPLSEAAVAKTPIAAAERLRKALDDPGFYVGEASMEGPTDAWDIITAAAQNWLKILEADPELVERIVVILRQGAQEYGGMEKLALAILAALITTDSEET